MVAAAAVGFSEVLGFQTFDRVIRRTVKLMQEDGGWIEAERKEG